MLAIKDQHWGCLEDSLGPLLTQSMTAESLYPGETGKEDRKRIGKCRQEVQAGKKGGRRGILMDSPGCC